MDGAGNAYIAGYAHSLDFPVTAGAFQTRNKAATTQGVDSVIPGYNAFVAKINPAGSALVFSTYLGGSGVTNASVGSAILYGDEANALALDAAGNVYVGGSTYSADFPVTSGAFQPKLHAAQPARITTLAAINCNAFVTKMNAAGTGLIYSTFLGGTGSDRVNGMEVDGAGNASLARETTSIDFPIVVGALQPANKAAVANHAGSAFFAELNLGGGALLYFTYLGGSGFVNTGGQPVGDAAYALAQDAAANLYVAGAAGSADFPATGGAFQTGNNAAGVRGQNAFVVRLNLNGAVGGNPPTMRSNLGVVDSAFFAPVLTAGGLATVFGNNLANVAISGGSSPLADNLGGTQLTIGGIPAPLLYVSPTQINFRVPWELAGQFQATVIVTTPFGSTSAQTSVGR